MFLPPKGQTWTRICLRLEEFAESPFPQDALFFPVASRTGIPRYTFDEQLRND